MLYICIESIALTHMRINVVFGHEQNSKKDEDDDDLLEEDIFAALNDP
jgi:hypothetical protein